MMITIHYHSVMKTIAFTIEEHLLERIDRLAARKTTATTNRSQILRLAVAEFLAERERLEEEEREREIFRRHRDKLAKQAAALVQEQADL